MNFLRKILFPVAFVYWIVTWMRNFFYDKQVFKSKSFDLPIIAVGNLSVGGTGKTPLTIKLNHILQKLKHGSTSKLFASSFFERLSFDYKGSYRADWYFT